MLQSVALKRIHYFACTHFLSHSLAEVAEEKDKAEVTDEDEEEQCTIVK